MEINKIAINKIVMTYSIPGRIFYNAKTGTNMELMHSRPREQVHVVHMFLTSLRCDIRTSGIHSENFEEFRLPCMSHVGAHL
jgi:hypothetical protein